MPSTFWVSRRSVRRCQQIIMGLSPEVGNSTNGSDGETIAIIARRCGGCVSAVSQQLRPPYDPPMMPTLPPDVLGLRGATHRGFSDQLDQQPGLLQRSRVVLEGMSGAHEPHREAVALLRLVEPSLLEVRRVHDEDRVGVEALEVTRVRHR